MMTRQGIILTSVIAEGIPTHCNENAVLDAAG